MTLMNKTILITGGTGSFGQKLVEILLKEYSPSSIRIYSRGEFLQDEMAKKFNDGRLRFLIGDVRDKARLYRAMEGVHTVFHAAAIKQIPTAEYNPIEAINTNIGGAINVIDATLDTGVEKVMAISTDKSASPANLYGATKLVAEKLFIQANVYKGWKDIRFACVRYGNVIGSRGSVIPLFLEQRESGEITITDEHMTRFWITLEQGVRFAIKCVLGMQGGEIFIPKIPSMTIVDVAEAIAPKVKRKVIGLRPGEKLHETLITEQERRHTKELDDHFIILPEFSFWIEETLEDSEIVMCEEPYSSDNNTEWLTKDELRRMIKEVGK